MKVKPLGSGRIGNELPADASFALAIRRRIGPGAGFGFAVLGNAKMGGTNPLGGIYQKRVTGYNHTGRIAGRKRRVYYVKMRHYAPTNPKTAEQQIVRTKFANAISAWQGLTLEQKQQYNSRVGGRNLSGYNLFIREYLKTH